ncbi:endo alpha-1,4 polygalactosaminidase [Actinoallomurus sp. CA-150999]|uniref:endo alpha-1,4 polygalactosaminidase n=1 Tax=Actinoallomurus sp. CA-150999 TaxID=3239887 RepID=UPI003D902FA6
MRVRARLAAAFSAALISCLGLTACATSGPEATLRSASGPDAASKAAALPAPVSCSGCWKPALNTSWQWQLKTVPSAPYLDVAMYDIDGFDATAADVSKLHSTKSGRKVVCYISAGTYEDWRPDAGDFPSSVLGNNVDGWPGERWLDVRQYGGKLGTILQKRMDMCKSKGFDAIEFDNVDGYTNDPGFSISADDQLNFNTWLANEAHRRGLSAGLKNDMDQLQTLQPYFDWALNEECWTNKECTSAQTGGYGYDKYVAAGKAVFNVEYNLDTSKFCSKANAQNFNSLKKDLDLTAYRVPCRGV